MTNLSKYITGVAAKRLSAVETDPKVSNQHEFQGTINMRAIFGVEDKKFKCTYLYLGDDEDETVSSEGTLSWYDSRRDKPHRTPEFRYYYNGNNVTQLASEGDLLIIAQKLDDTILALIVKQGSTIEHQVLWLFGLEIDGNKFVISKIKGDQDKPIGFAENTILETINIEAEIITDENWLDQIAKKFKSYEFPTTDKFSAFARETINISSIEDPDVALLEWINHEEMLFKTLEKYIVNIKINTGFNDVDDFVSFSQSVHQRRKSRMGHALENHLKQIFIDHNVSYSRGKETENNSKPDFMFPSITHYHDETFPSSRLTMLGSKSTCKDRWRQVLSEASRITNKHLLTLEPGISKNQTDEMNSQRLNLVIPYGLHNTYLKQQQEWLMTLSGFLEIVKEKQNI